MTPLDSLLAVEIASRQATLRNGAAALLNTQEAQGLALQELYVAVQQALSTPPPNTQPGGEPAKLWEPFAPDSLYDYLPDIPEAAKLLGWYTPWINNAGPGEPFDLAEIAPGVYAGHNAKAPISESKEAWGPDWGMRLYRCTGTLEGVTLHRIGDWTKLREGHGGYLSPMFGDLLIRDCHMVGCGGHAWHVRAISEEHDPGSGIPSALLPRPGDVMEWDGCSALQCDAIDEGHSPRASWPFNFTNPGMRWRQVGCTVETDHSARGHKACATGAFFYGFDQEPRRCERGESYNAKAVLTKSDRAVVFLEGQDEVLFEEPDLWETDRPAARFRIVDGCGRVTINRPRRDLLVEFAPVNDEGGAAYREPYKVEPVKAGTVWSFDGI